MGTKRKISILCSILIVTSPVIAAFLALVLLLHSSLQAHANTWGNVDQLESGEVSGSAQGCFSSPIWGSTTYCVSQRYGCTDFSGESPTDAPGVPTYAQVCNSLGSAWKFWHHGIDLLLPSGTPVYSPVSGQVAAYDTTYAALGIRNGSGQVVYLIHGTPASGIGVNSVVTRGQHVYDSDNLGVSSGPHLHLEVHSSQIGVRIGDPGYWDDINPEGWLKTIATGASAVSWSSNRLDLFVRGQSHGFWHQYSGDGTNWSGSWEDHSFPSRTTGFISQPVAVAWAPTRLDIFGIGSDGHLYHQYWDGSSWGPAPPSGLLPYQGWDSFPLPPGGVGLTGNPAVTTWGTDRLDIFARDVNGTIWHACWAEDANRLNPTWCTFGLNSWESIGSSAASDPVATSWGPNRLDVFVRGFDNAIKHQYCAAACTGGGWASQWEDHGTPGVAFASKPSVVSWDANRLDLFGTDANGNIDQQWWNGQYWNPTPGTNSWYGLTGSGSYMGDAAVASWTQNRIDLFIKDTSNASWHLPYANGWGTWENHGGQFSSPDLTEISWGPNRLDVFGTGWSPSYNTYWQNWAGTAWTSWTNLGGYAT